MDQSAADGPGVSDAGNDVSSVFGLESTYAPAGDQPQAITSISHALGHKEKFVTLEGITGSGKSFTVANVIAQRGRQALVLAPNKALAAQLFAEMRQMFPNNRVEYFVSYYDYYQPEAYVPASDTYIDKTATINDEIDRLRHSATEAALTRADTIIVASVSAIYGLGDPSGYRSAMLQVHVGQQVPRDEVLKQLVRMRFERNDVEPIRAQFRVRGDTLEVFTAGRGELWRIEWFGDDIERITRVDPLSREVQEEADSVLFAPASHYAHGVELEPVCEAIRTELSGQLEVFSKQGKLIESQRLRERVARDVELLEQTGWCPGVENYSRHLEGREVGQRPWTLLDYLEPGFLLVVDESHVSVPQIGGARNGDRVRKQTLVDYGFRLPSALDNRPLDADELWELCDEHDAQVLFVSATPGPFELEVSATMVPQVIRPTGLLDPDVVMRPRQGALVDLLGEIRERTARGWRVLVTTLTKRSAEELTTWLGEQKVRCRYMHSDIDTLERIEILRDLRLGTFDVLVGINLLREGLDLPEVELVAVLDADTEGFLRSERSLLQTIGRAARNSGGTVVLYADKVTPAMDRAMTITAERRALQEAYNQLHEITPTTITKAVGDLIAELDLRGSTAVVAPVVGELDEVEDRELQARVIEYEAAMLEAAEQLRFEDAAVWRDRLDQAQQELARRLI